MTFSISTHDLDLTSTGEYIQVRPQEEEPSWGELTESAAHSMFLTEIARGMMVTLGYLFKEPATINYPFEKGDRGIFPPVLSEPQRKNSD